MTNTVLFYDLETNGLDPKQHQAVEVAGILWSCHHRSTISGFSFVIKADDNQAHTVNGIPVELLQNHGTPPVEAWKRVAAWMARADVVVAHNGGFDRSFTPPEVSPGKTWVCTQDDVDWPRPSTSNKLVDILLAHGLGVSHAHRALVDVMNLARLFERVAEMGHAPGDLLARAMRPKHTYKAHVTFQTNQLAKEAGFRWDPDRKIWWRRLAVEDVPALAAKLRFGISEVP